MFILENMSQHNELRAGVIFVDAIPRNPHHKLKRNELRELALKLHAERKLLSQQYVSNNH